MEAAVLAGQTFQQPGGLFVIPKLLGRLDQSTNLGEDIEVLSPQRFGAAV